MTKRQNAPPAHLSADAQVRWRAVFPELSKRGRVDTTLLETYCQVWVRWRQAETAIEKMGSLVKSGASVKASPLLAVSNKAATQARALEKQLGIGTADTEQDDGISLRAFARLIGVSDTAVRKGEATGRLRDSIRRDGRGRVSVVDVALARKEWVERAAKAPKGESGDQTLADVQRDLGVERMRSIRMANDVRDGRLFDLSTKLRTDYEVARTLTENFLNLPARISAELAAETDAARIYARLDAEIRQVLTVIADRFKELAGVA